MMPIGEGPLKILLLLRRVAGVLRILFRDTFGNHRDKLDIF
jgi:hypothetical protein